MPEFPLILGQGVVVVEGVGLLVADDGLLYHQDADGHRIPLAAALAGAVTASGEFSAVGYDSADDDGSGGGYVDHSPAVIAGAEAQVYATGPADTDDMHPGNFAFHYDVAGGEIVFTALDDDGTVLTGSVALS